MPMILIGPVRMLGSNFGKGLSKDIGMRNFELLWIYLFQSIDFFCPIIFIFFHLIKQTLNKPKA